MIGFGMAVPMLAVTGGGGRAPVNLLDDSWQFESAYWNGASAAITLTPGQSDPFGGAKASSFVNIGAASAFYQEFSLSETLTNYGLAGVSDFVVAAYFKQGAGGDLPSGSLRLYNSTIGPGGGGLLTQNFSWSSGVMIEGSRGGDGIGTGGVEVIGDGWYRSWFTVDLDYNIASEGWAMSDTCRPQLNLWGSSETVGLECLAVGVQINPGTSPGAYLEKP